MHRVKFNDYAELLSDDLNNNNAYLYNGLITTIADFIAANDCVSGLEVTAQAVPDMTVYVKAGRIYQDGYQGFLEADLTTPLTIAPASANQPRIDLICAKYEEVEDEPEIRNVMTDVVSRNITQVEVKTRIASSIAFQVVGGTAAAEPTVPTTPEGWVALAKVTIPANTSVIQQSNIVDMRPKIINIYQHDHSGGANGAKLDYNNLENLPDLSVFKGATTSNNGTKGMVPAPAKGNNNRYLKSDATWGEIDTMKGATSSAAGAAGLVPAPAAGENDEFLRGDGTWQPINTMKGASASAAGAAGLVPAPAKGEDDEFLRGDGTWQPISNMKGASSNAAGASGLVPAPAKGDQNKALFGDATYKQVVQKVNGVAADNEGDVSLRNALYCHDASEFMEELGTAGWNSKGVYAVTFTNTDNFPQKPSNSYFALFNLAETSNNGYAIQMLLNVINGDLYTRGTNNQAELDEVPFKRLAFYSEVLAALPVGTILPFAGSSIPTGFLACNGAGVRATTYANLYAVIGNTYGGDSTTFNLPQIEDNRFLEFSSARGTKHNAGLPNITGSYPRCPHEENLYQEPTGAFGMAGPSPEIPGTSSESSNTRGLSFDASRSNSIYGGSTTVQPKSLTVRAIIKY